MHFKTLVASVLLSGMLSVQESSAQNISDNTASDLEYYSNWEGRWYRDKEDSISSSPTFVVKKGLFDHAFEEFWMGAGGEFSMAWRAWDKMSKSWQFAWVSPDGYLQLWEGKKVDGIWYMYKTFNINGEEILSRQAFIPQGDSRLLRTSEHSKDGGKTWKLRFEEKYVKK